MMSIPIPQYQSCVETFVTDFCFICWYGSVNLLNNIAKVSSKTVGVEQKSP